MVDGPNIAQCWHRQDISGQKIRIFNFFIGENLAGWSVIWMEEKLFQNGWNLDKQSCPITKGVDILEFKNAALILRSSLRAQCAAQF